MGVTPQFRLPWPERPDAADGPSSLKKLAQAIEAVISSINSPVIHPGILQYRLNDFSVVASKQATPVALDRSMYKYGNWTTDANGHPRVPVSGRYMITAEMSYVVDPDENRFVGVFFNGAPSLLPNLASLVEGVVSNSTVLQVAGAADLKAGDTVGLYTWQYSGGTLVCTTALLSVDLFSDYPLASYRIGHADYTSAGNRVTTYTITPAPETLVGDWLYIIHEHFRETSDINPDWTGWEQIVAPQLTGTIASGGAQWSIWRRKHAGAASYTVTLPNARYVRASLLTIRQLGDAVPVVSPLVPQRAAASPSVISVPGGQAGKLIVSIALQNTASVTFTPPPTVTGPATHWFSVPSIAGTTFFSVAASDSAASTAPIVFSWPVADAGRIGGVTLSF
jgi:hypothetical protein